MKNGDLPVGRGAYSGHASFACVKKSGACEKNLLPYFFFSRIFSTPENQEK
jgi:hypothetical protein